MTIDEAYKTCFCEPYIVPVDKHKEARAIIDKALEEVQQYREMENRLKKVYGDYPGLLEIVITHLERHDGVDIPEPVFKAR